MKSSGCTDKAEKARAYLEKVVSEEGYAAARETVQDWQDVLQELSEAGQNTAALQQNVLVAAGRAGILRSSEHYFPASQSSNVSPVTVRVPPN